MINIPERCRFQITPPDRRFTQSRYVAVVGVILSLVVLFAVWAASERYFYGETQKDFASHAGEHLQLLGDRVREHNRPPLEAAGKITAHRDDFFLEITDSRGAVLYLTPGRDDYASQHFVEKNMTVYGEPWTLRYTSTPSFDAAHKSRLPILFAVGGMVLHLLLLYVIIDLLRSRAMLKSKASELENSREWLDTILNSSVDGIHILDTEGRLAACSPSFLQMLGYSDADAPNLSVYDWEVKFPAEAIPVMIESLSEVPRRFESLFRRKDSSLIDVETTIRAIFEGTRRYVYASSRDISERKRAEQALWHEKETAQNYLDIVDVMIIIIDPDWTVRLINRKGCEIIGYRAEETVGKNWLELCVPREIRGELTEVRETLSNFEGPLYYENRVVTKSGEERLIAWRNQVLVDAGGLFAGILSSGEDITRMRRDQKRLQESESFYKSMFTSLNEAIIILEGDVMIDCNAVAEEIFEISKETLYGRVLIEILPESECREYGFDQCLASAYLHGVIRTECSFGFGDGRTKIIDLTLSRFGGSGEKKLLLIARDVTEKSDEERLFRMYTRQAQMGEMISMIAHQWRQPLAIINAITSQMRLRALVSGEQDEGFIDNLVKIEEQSSHLSQTISDYRDFFRPDKPMERFAVSSLLNNALGLIDHTLKNHSIRIETWITCDPLLYTYRNEVLQVLMALLKNALDAFLETKRKEGNRIILGVDQDDAYAILTIRDNAGGIAPGAMKKLFTPYFTTKQKSYGTGLGLYMSKIIIQEHCGGTIALESRGDETVVTVKIPYQKEKS